MPVDLATLALKVEALEVDAASKKLDNLTAAGGRTEKAAGGVTSAFKAVGSALAAVAFAQSIRQAVELADSYTRIEGRLKLVTSSATELASVQNALYAISQRSRAEYLATADVYNRFAQATKGQGIAQAELLGITETLNKAFAISGASTSEAAGAMVQLSQGFSSGVLRGDEFNTVMETGGRVVDLLADYLGVGRGELRGMAEDGKLTSDVLRNAITSGASEVNAEFDKMPATVGQAGTVLMNTLGQLVADANKASGATAGIADAIMGLAKTVDEHKGGILSFFSAMAGAGAQTFSGFEMGAEAAIGSLGELESKIGSRIPGITAKVTELEAEIAKVNDSIALRTSRGASTDANKADLAMLTYQLEQQKKLMKDLTSSPYITGEAAGKLNIVAEATQNVTFAMEGVKSQSESSMRITDEMRKKTLSYIETKEQSLKREKDAAMSGAKSTEERALVEKKYLDEIGKLHEKNGKSSDAAAKKAETAAKRQAEEYQHILDSLEPARVEQERYNEALAVLNKLDPTHETERYKEGLKQLNSTLSANIELEEYREDIISQRADYEKQATQASMTDAEIRIDNINRELLALEEYGQRLVGLGEAEQAIVDANNEAFGERARKQIEAITDDAGEMGKMFDDVAKNIQSAFAGMFEDMLDGSGNILDSLGDMFKKLLAQMATMAIANPIIVPIVTTIGTGMGMSTSSIASTLGMDTSQISGSSGMGGVSSLFSAGSSLFSSGSLQGMGVSSLANIGGFAQNIGLTSVGNIAMEAGTWLNSLSSGLADGLVAGVGSLAVSLLSGEGLTANTGLQAAGAAIGSIYGPVGSVVGGIIGGLVGGMFGTGEDTFGPQYMANDVGVNYSATSGMTPTTIQYTGGDTDSQIAKVYAEQMRSIQTAFNEQVTAMAEALPDEISSAMLDSLASANLKQILNDVSGQEINVKDAASWLTTVAEDYSEALVAELGKAYGTALSSFISTQGAEGLVGDSVAWSMLTEAVKQNITDSFQSAADTIAGGDIDTGLSTINSVTNAIAAIESAMAPISEIIATDGLTDYEKSIRSINIQFDSYRDALESAGVDMEKYTDLEKARGIALAQVVNPAVEEAAEAARAMAEALSGAMTPVNEIIATSGLSDYELEIRAINQQFDDYAQTVKQSGGGVYQLIRIEKARAIQLAKVVNPAIQEAIDKENELAASRKSILDEQIAAYGSLTESVAATAQRNYAGMSAAEVNQFGGFIDFIEGANEALGKLSDTGEETSAEFVKISEMINSATAQLARDLSLDRLLAGEGLAAVIALIKDPAYDLEPAVEKLLETTKQFSMSIPDFQKVMADIYAPINNDKGDPRFKETATISWEDQARSGMDAIKGAFGQFITMSFDMAESLDSSSQAIEEVTTTIGLMQSVVDVFSRYVGEFESVNTPGWTIDSMGVPSSVVAEAAKLISESLTTQNAAAVSGRLSGIEAFAGVESDRMREYSMLLEGVSAFNVKALNDAFVRITAEFSESVLSGGSAPGSMTNEQYTALIADAVKIYNGESDPSSSAESLSNQRRELEIKIMDAMGQTEEALVARRQIELEAMDESLRPLQERLYALTDEANALALADQARALEIQAMEASGQTAEALSARRQIELEAMDESLRPLKERLYLLADEKTATDALNASLAAIRGVMDGVNDTIDTSGMSDLDINLRSINEQYDAYVETLKKNNAAAGDLEKVEQARSIDLDKITAAALKAANDAALSNAEDMLRKSFDAEQNLLKERHELAVDALNTQLDTARDSVSTLSSLSSSLRSTLKGLSLETAGFAEAQRKKAQEYLQEALINARSGLMPESEEMGAALSTLAKSSTDIFANAEDYQRDYWQTYLQLAEMSQLTDDQLTVEQQIVNGLEEQLEAEGRWYEEQGGLLTSQLDAILGVDNSIMSLADAISGYQTSAAAVKIAEEVIAPTVNIGGGGTTATTPTTTDYLALTYADYLASSSHTSGTLSPDDYEVMISGAAALGIRPSFAVGTDYVPYDMTADIHQGERIIPAAYNRSDATNAEIVAMLKEVVASVRATGTASAKASEKVATILDTWDYDGIPEARTV